jgi:O-antigen ligase
MSLRLVAALYGAWLFLIVLVFYAVGGKNENALQFAVMVGTVPTGIQLLSLGFDSRGLGGPTLFSLFILLTVLFSYLANIGYVANWTPVIYTINVIFLLSVGILIAGSPDERLMRTAAAAYALITSIFLVYINLYGAYVWGRLTAGLQPNFWGLVGLSVAATSFGFRRLPFALPPLLIGCWTMYEASSRGSMLGFAVGAGIVLIRSALELRGTRLYLALAGLAACGLLLTAFWSSLHIATADIGNSVLKLNDPNRGLDTGFSGREGIWTATLQIWLDHPVLGVGFREHEQILDFPSHNGYLAILADLGIVGFSIYCALLASSLVASWRVGERATRNLAIATIASYAVMSLFEDRAINTGNPFGFLMMMTCFTALGFKARQRLAASAARGSAAAGGEAADLMPAIRA